MFYLKFDTKKDRILPPLLAMFDEISHVNRFIGNGRHGVSFFGCYNIPFVGSSSSSQSIKKRKEKTKQIKKKGTKQKIIMLEEINQVALSYVMGRRLRDRINIDAHIKSIRHL
jgi:hypothetical protein